MAAHSAPPPSKSPLAGERGLGVFFLFFLFYKDKSHNLSKIVLVLLSALVERVGCVPYAGFFQKWSKNCEYYTSWPFFNALCVCILFFNFSNFNRFWKKLTSHTFSNLAKIIILELLKILQKLSLNKITIFLWSKLHCKIQIPRSSSK